MRDGVKLAADVYLPQGEGPWPVILTHTPYLKQNMFRAAGGERFVKAGYAYVVRDVRGKGHSQGFYAAFVNDIEEGYDTVEALARSPGRTARWGSPGPRPWASPRTWRLSPGRRT